MENLNLKAYKGESRILRKDGRYTTRKWREPIANLGKWVREREKFMRDIYRFKTFDLNFGPDGCVTMECERPEGIYNWRHFRRMNVIYKFTPIQ